MLTIFQIYTDDDYYFMEVLDAAESDRGQYTCVISNCVATESVSAALEVYIKARQYYINYTFISIIYYYKLIIFQFKVDEDKSFGRALESNAEGRRFKPRPILS